MKQGHVCDEYIMDYFFGSKDQIFNLFS